MITFGADNPSHSGFKASVSSLLCILSVRLHLPVCRIPCRIPKRAPPVAWNSSSSVYSVLTFFFLVSLSFDFFDFLDFFLSFLFCNLARVFPTAPFHHSLPTCNSSNSWLPDVPTPPSSNFLVTVMCDDMPCRFFPSPCPCFHPNFSNCF